MNFSNICEQTFVEGFLIEAFSSLEEAQKYHTLVPRQEISQSGICLKPQDWSIHCNLVEEKDTQFASLPDDSHIGMKETLFQNDSYWNKNHGDTKRLVEGYLSKDATNTMLDGKQTSNRNGKRAAWTEHGIIQVGGRNQVHSFQVDDRKMLASYTKSPKEHRIPTTMTGGNANNNEWPIQTSKTMNAVIACPYTTSTLRGKWMQLQTSPSHRESSYTICSSDVVVPESGVKGHHHESNSFSFHRGSPSYSLSTVSFTSNRSSHHLWNSFEKAERASTGTSSLPQVTIVQRCENCGREHYGGFASGRFCSSKCARTVGGNARKRQRLEAQGIRFDDNGNPLDPIPKRLRYTPKHNVHREGDKPGKGYRLCVHCKQPTPNRKVKCQYCGKENPNAARSRKLYDERQTSSNPITVHSDTPPQTTSSPSTTWISTWKSDEENKTENQPTMHSETEEEDDEDVVNDNEQNNNTQHKKQIQFLLNPS
ncbi:hypothetical protein GpartN1_g3889.t1 [Galdieria partita]|uniref:Uncharacterized protein n=1 Tax=Galdieria partita TaxID=83374 RepID=A0A9C7UQQ1_9RHOD|nr:hypothetical protein GpartN1_g3889.t1 [Galdieria partita]